MSVISVWILHVWGPGCVVGRDTGYGMDGPGIESRWKRDFPHLTRPALGPTQHLAQWVPGLFWGKKEQPGRDADPSPPSSAVGHESVELCLYSPYGPYGLYRASVPVQGWPLPLVYGDNSFTNTCTNHRRCNVSCINTINYNEHPSFALDNLCLLVWRNPNTLAKYFCMSNVKLT
jgi:hypothetical protein